MAEAGITHGVDRSPRVCPIEATGLQWLRERELTVLSLQAWELWIPDAAATGIPFARGQLDATDVLIVHSAPHLLTVEVRDAGGELVASGRDLRRSDQVPMTRLRLEGQAVTREEFWPAPADYGTPVLLPGGEVGLLRDWWHRDDRREWRWLVEFHNRVD